MPPEVAGPAGRQGPRGSREPPFVAADARGRRRGLQLPRTGDEGSWRAKNLLRAAGLPLLKPKQSAEVASKLRDTNEGRPVPPILLLHDGTGFLEIADGYHRACAACILDEDAKVPGRVARLVRLTGARR